MKYIHMSMNLHTYMFLRKNHFKHFKIYKHNTYAYIYTYADYISLSQNQISKLLILHAHIVFVEYAFIS